MAKSLNELKKTTKVAALAPVGTIAPVQGEEAPKTTKRSFSEEDAKRYLAILSDGQPHRIQDLLKEFGLPSSTSGREKLRQENRKINSEGKFKVLPVFPDGLQGKHFQLIENANGGKVLDEATTTPVEVALVENPVEVAPV